MLDIIDISCYIFFGGALLFAAFGYAFNYYFIKRNRSSDGFKKMKKQLLDLLREDGYDCRKEEDMVVVNYRQMRFNILFSGSIFGYPYARVMIINKYAIEGMEELHPFVMDTIMGRATYRNVHTGNISFEDHCSCYFCTDVKSIKDFYRGLNPILLMLIEHENGVYKDFAQFHHDFVGQNNNQEGNHIGFKKARNDHNNDETSHSVAAETATTK